jgi:hypothetical protein
MEALKRPMKGGRVGGTGGGITITFMNNLLGHPFIHVANKNERNEPQKKTQFSLLMM